MSDKIPGTDLTADDVVRKMVQDAAQSFLMAGGFRPSSLIVEKADVYPEEAIAICRHYGYDPETGEEIGGGDE